MNDTQPIILIGAARSGTKFLRNILSAQPGVCAVPYDVNYIWRYGCAIDADDVLDPLTLTDARRTFIRTQLTRLSKAREGDVVLEKTVSNTLRVPFVENVYPGARYVHLVRDGRSVVESAMRQWEAPPNWLGLLQKLRNLPLANLGYAAWFSVNFIRGRWAGRGGGKVWGPRFPSSNELVTKMSLAEICATQWVQSVTRARDDLAALPASNDRVYTIRYEDLVADSDAVTALSEWLGFGDSTPVLTAYHARVRSSGDVLWTDLSIEDQTSICQIVDVTLTDLGYLP